MLAPQLCRVWGVTGSAAGRHLGGRPRPGNSSDAGIPLDMVREADSVGVVWGEGDGAANQCGPAIGVGISDWIERLIRAAWRRFFLHGGEL